MARAFRPGRGPTTPGLLVLGFAAACLVAPSSAWPMEVLGEAYSNAFVAPSATAPPAGGAGRDV